MKVFALFFAVATAGWAEQPVHLVGEADLCRLYARALAACGRIAVVETGDAASRGLARIGGLAPWT